MARRCAPVPLTTVSSTFATTMKTSIFALVVAAAHAAYPIYEVPAFDLRDANEGPALVAAIKETGIVALKNIPNYESTRAAYLKAADACVSARDAPVTHKRLVDGTRRRTLSTFADLDVVPDSLTAACPDYVAALTAFNGVVDQATLAFAKALDGSSGAESKPVEDVITHGQHLEHLHAYSNPVVSRAAPSDVSLEWHTDTGVGIFTAAPTFFDGANNEVANPDENAGLIVMLHGKEYKPTQKADELLVMIGQGFNDWGNFGLRLPPVLHAMFMPRAAPSDVKRIFYGRMALLKPDAVVAHAKMTYDEFSQGNKRFLLGQDDDFATIACPVGRRLQASEASCTVGIWAPSNASAANVTKAKCMRDCNVDTSVEHMKADFQRCLDMKCEKKSEVANGGTTCWMVCVQKYSDATCPSKTQTCVDDSLICQGGTVAPVPTAAPTTTPAAGTKTGAANALSVGAAVAAAFLATVL
ncbi:Aste57867_24881 [Aphanomyces stellatus]|uniref:Aste57867_24881 protein n=1 Tax=Aphanomyces stellatus TaxID=120398 RepID=A0A485LRQ0_9STRA|nr:hypothetical protein As57867_024803 [Aphanomyces stellatus]VFU01515.1 Aste57867_24881 [Aphanomyces stellatus]